MSKLTMGRFAFESGVALDPCAADVFTRAGVITAAQAPQMRRASESAVMKQEALRASERQREAEASRWRDAVREKVRDGRWSEIKPDEQRWILSALEADYGDE